MGDAEIRDLIREKRDTWRKMANGIKSRPKPWTAETACRYEQYDLVAMVMNELLELTEDDETRG